jgi:outer membrane lipoprotein SlyB
MKIVAVTVAVLALGLAGCAREDVAANEDMTANEFETENVADNDMDAANAADNALLNAEQAIENVQEEADEAAAALENVQ